MVKIPRLLSGAFDWHPGLCPLIELSRAINHLITLGHSRAFRIGTYTKLQSNWD